MTEEREAIGQTSSLKGVGDGSTHGAILLLIYCAAVISSISVVGPFTARGTPAVNGDNTGTMVKVGGGCYTMGANGVQSDNPPHKVCVSGFSMDRDEVTVEQSGPPAGRKIDAPARGHGSKSNPWKSPKGRGSPAGGDPGVCPLG